jgi:hypothetical protein
MLRLRRATGGNQEVTGKGRCSYEKFVILPKNPKLDHVGEGCTGPGCKDFPLLTEIG